MQSLRSLGYRVYHQPIQRRSKQLAYRACVCVCLQTLPKDVVTKLWAAVEKGSFDDVRDEVCGLAPTFFLCLLLLLVPWQVC